MPDPIFEFDELKAYFCEDYAVTQDINIHSPTVGDIIEYGEKRYFSLVYTLTAIPSDMKSTLFDMNIDYETLSDFSLFYMLTRSITPKDSNILFNEEIDFSKMEIYKDISNDKLAMSDGKIVFDELAYLKMANYLRKIHGIKSKVEKAYNKTTKQILIQLDREKRQKASESAYQSQLKPLISAMMRYPGFKYKSYELKQCSLYEFMDTVKGSSIYIHSTSLLNGMYSGMIDTSKINKKEFDWMRDTF